MENYEHIYRIALLLSRMSAGMITEEENDELLNWVARSAENKTLYDRWLQGDGFQEDFKTYSGFDVARAQKDLERRIGNHKDMRNKRRRKLITKITIFSAAAVVLLMALYIAWERPDHQPEQQISLISPDNTILYFEGRSISLDNAAITTDNGEFKVVEADGTEHILTSQEGYVSEGAKPLISIVVPKGRIFALTLEDGTAVTLNAASTLRYPLNFEKELREVWLSGEAYFKAVGDPSRPFRVITDNQTVEVIGTEFNVNAYPQNAHTATTVFKGKVKAKHADNQGVITPGMQIVSGADRWLLHSVKLDNIAAWRNELFNLEGKSLESVMSELSRWYDFEVVYESDRLKEIMFKGTVPRYDSFGKILGLMQKTEEIKFEVHGSTVTVMTYRSDY